MLWSERSRGRDSRGLRRGFGRWSGVGAWVSEGEMGRGMEGEGRRTVGASLFDIIADGRSVGERVRVTVQTDGGVSSGGPRAEELHRVAPTANSAGAVLRSYSGCESCFRYQVKGDGGASKNRVQRQQPSGPTKSFGRSHELSSFGGIFLQTIDRQIGRPQTSLRRGIV